MKVILTIQELENLLKVAKKAYEQDSLTMSDTVEIELVSVSTVSGASDRIKANLQYGWDELGSEKIFSN
jgi:hypothetical protein